MIFFFQTGQVLIAAFIAAKTMNLAARLDPNGILRGNISSADWIFYHNPVSRHLFLLFGLVLLFLFLITNKQLVNDKGCRSKNNKP